MRLTYTACAMALTLGAASFATSAQAVPLASAFPSVAAADSSFTKIHMSKKQHMMMMKKKQHMMMKKKQHMM